MRAAITVALVTQGRIARPETNRSFLARETKRLADSSALRPPGSRKNCSISPFVIGSSTNSSGLVNNCRSSPAFFWRKTCHSFVPAGATAAKHEYTFPKHIPTTSNIVAQRLGINVRIPAFCPTANPKKEPMTPPFCGFSDHPSCLSRSTRIRNCCLNHDVGRTALDRGVSSSDGACR